VGGNRVDRAVCHSSDSNTATKHGDDVDLYDLS